MSLYDKIIAVFENSEKLKATKQEVKEVKEIADNALKIAGESTGASTLYAPMIGKNGNWYTWDIASESYIDSGVRAEGKDGQDGYTPQKGVDYFDGKNGEDGYTPKKGTDYWTEADKEEILSETEPFVIQAMYDVNDTKTVTADKTFAEIQQAVTDNKYVVLRLSFDYSNEIMLLSLVSLTENLFATFSIAENKMVYTILCNAKEEWDYSETVIKTPSYVTQILDTASDTEVPTAKAVVGYMEAEREDIESYINETFLGGAW